MAFGHLRLKRLTPFVSGISWKAAISGPSYRRLIFVIFIGGFLRACVRMGVSCRGPSAPNLHRISSLYIMGYIVKMAICPGVQGRTAFGLWRAALALAAPTFGAARVSWGRPDLAGAAREPSSSKLWLVRQLMNYRGAARRAENLVSKCLGGEPQALNNVATDEALNALANGRVRGEQTGKHCTGGEWLKDVKVRHGGCDLHGNAL